MEESQSPIYFDKTIFQPTALVLPEGHTFKQWEQAFKGVMLLGNASPWWAGDALNIGEHNHGEMYAQALDSSDYSLETLKKTKAVCLKIEKGRRRPFLSFAHHREVIKLEPPEQDRYLDIAEQEKLTRTQLRKRIKDDLAIDVKCEPLEGTYSTIIIDPPWDVVKIEREVRPNQTGFDYPTMTQEQLLKLPVPDIAADNSMIFLWTTVKHLFDAGDLLKAWGFKYIFEMAWHKPGGFQPVGLPQYNGEYILYGRKGSIKFVETKAFPIIFNGARREHSRKPEEFYEIIKRVTPEPRIDVFSREEREGFTAWGNETKLFKGVNK